MASVIYIERVLDSKDIIYIDINSKDVEINISSTMCHTFRDEY